MKLDGHKLGLAAAATSAVLFTVCSIFMQLWPEQMINMSAALFHLSNFGPLTPLFEMNAQLYISGLVQYSVYSYIYVYLFSYVHNCMHKKR